MTRTRRQAKETASESAGDATSQLSVSLDAVDEEVLYSVFPDGNFSVVTSDDVIELYRTIIDQSKALDALSRERDDATSAFERKDVEVDQALQDKERVVRELEEGVESLQAEASKLKQEKEQLSQEKSALSAQLANVSTSQSSSSHELDVVRHRVDDTEREKRELVAVISRLKDEAVQRDEEIHTLRENLKEARQEHQTLEGQVRELRSAETANKFKVDTLSQQLQLAQGEAERSNTELNEKAEEFVKYRRTKHAELTTLQASFDSLTQTHASTEASLKSLQSAHANQIHQLKQAQSKIQSLTDQLAEQEERYANEASGLRRLVAMMEEREKHAKGIVENIEQEWAAVGEKAERREAALRAEVDSERRRREETQKQLEQLEKVLERMGRGDLPVPGRGQDLVGEGIVGLSPTVAMASRVQRGGKTFTEIYAEYVQLQEDYARKTAEYDQMDRTLAAVLAQIEERAPILSQQRIEYERLQSEASQLASQLSQAIAERDSQSRHAQEQTQKLNKSTKETEMLQKSVDDLSRQVQTLLKEIARRDDPTIPADEELALANIEPTLNTESLITNNLVRFASIEMLQEQNSRLLMIVRDLGVKMESEEREYREQMERDQAEAVREAHEAMKELAEQLERQKKSHENIVQAYVKERDALRGMLARAEKGVRPTTNGDAMVTEHTDSELARELAEIQSQFEAYRTEMGTDSTHLRDQVSSAHKELNTVNTALAKANARIEFMSERARMHEEQFQTHHREVEELTKRNRQLLDQWTRMDIECNRVTEDLHSATSHVERLRNECANLRAEKKIWESIQGRLVDENRTLALERAHLSDLMANVQKMHNDLERSGENDRRRLESQLQMIEGQAQDLRAQVTQERDNARHATLQKDLELKELQSRLDKTVQELSKTRETLIESQTSRKHVEERLEGLNRQLAVVEEKLSVYERRPGGTNVITVTDPGMSREEQLEAEVADLRSALKAAEVDLASARSHKDQFQEISRASEAALQTLNTTYDEYKASSEATIARYESDIQSLQAKLDAAVTELNTAKTQFSETQKALEQEKKALLADKKTLEGTIFELSNVEKTSESDRAARELEFRNLEDRTKAAEERYSQEVISHAETLKNIEHLKKDLITLQGTVRDSVTSAETANAKLASSENSWKQQKEVLDKEVADLNARCKDLAAQNATLHQHLESVSNQATRIRQAADAAPAPAAEDTSGDADARLAELRSVVGYLRKEKEIVDLQLEMGKQENERLKSQIERLTVSLQEARTTLAEERERAVESTASAAQHAELVERINQLNILRESNATLRTECESASRKTRELENKLALLNSELQPAKEQATSALAELEVARGQMIRLEQESRRWQERNTQLLSKYDRVDPAEIQALKDGLAQAQAEVTTLKEEKDKFVASLAEANEKYETLDKMHRNAKEILAKNNASFRAKMSDLSGRNKHLTEEKESLEKKIAALEEEKVALASAPAPAPTSEAAQSQIDKIAALTEERDKLVAEKEALEQTLAARPAATGEEGDFAKERAELLQKLKAATMEAQKSAVDTKNARLHSEKLQSRLQELMRTQKAEAEKHQAALAEATAKAQAAGTTAPVADDALAKKHEEEIKALTAQLKLEHEAALKAAVEEALKSQPVANGDQQAAIAQAIREYEEKTALRQAEEIAAAVERGRMEAASKLKLKEAQLSKAQARVKGLEAQLVEAGVTAPPPSAPATATMPVTPTTSIANATAAVKPSPARPTPTGPQGTTAARQPVRPAAAKPVQPAATAPAAAMAAPTTATATGPPPAGPAAAAAAPLRPPTRGMARGRGLPTGPGRGGAQRVPPVKQASQASVTPPPGGVSILGAASKRPREEGTTPAEDSLAKRLKPAEPAQ